MNRGFTGISFPFHFSSKGGIATSTTSPTDFSHIRESVEQIIRTQIKERVMESSFGTDSLSFLFEPLDGDATILGVAKYNVTQALQKWEKRINVDNVTVTSDRVNSTLIITVDYTVLQTQMSDSVSVMMTSS